MNKKTRVAIVFGGKSAEHEVSLQSAKNIVEAIDKEKYEIALIGIDKKGHWYLNDSSKFLLNSNNPKLIKLEKASDNLALVPGEEANQLINLSNNQTIGRVDVVFPILHGPFGEDGTVQGFLKMANIPFVGSSVLGSAAGMDKDVTKRLLRDAGVPIAKFITFGRNSLDDISFDKMQRLLGTPFFVKPANLGSSVGISKVNSEEEFQNAIISAFEYDNKILIEEYIRGREIECSVLGNDNPTASIPGEVLVQDEFYSYKAKYIDEKGAVLDIPAKLSSDVLKKIQYYAIKAFKVLCCEGMARVDFFLQDDGNIIVNELNTIPGFTKISMYPKLWAASGISYPELIDRLINLAIERFDKEQKLKTDFSESDGGDS